MKKISKSTGGFSLVEIIIVLAIIAAISGISIPVYRQIRPTIGLNAETREFISDLRLAQQLAVTEQKNYLVAVNQPGNSYSLIDSVSGQTVKTKFVNSQITIVSVVGFSDNTISFNVTGAAAESGTIILGNSQGKQETIEIKPSGYVTTY